MQLHREVQLLFLMSKIEIFYPLLLAFKYTNNFKNIYG